jgi:hypothetical protein
MSESGQTRPFGDVRLMSGLPPKAAIEWTSVDVSKVPLADIGADHVVGTRLQH